MSLFECRLNNQTKFTMNETIKIFISYGVTDDNLGIPDLIKSDFDKILKDIGDNNIKLTFDREFLKGGDKWDDRIKEELSSSHVIFFLINEKFLVSEYIKNIEFNDSIRRTDVKIFHAKLFKCGNYEGLKDIQSINLGNIPYLDMMEEEYESNSKNRFEIKKIADRLYVEIKSNFKSNFSTNIDGNNGKEIIPSVELSKLKVNRNKELAHFESMISKANPPSCDLFLYGATKYDVARYFNYRTDETLNNIPAHLSIKNPKYIDLQVFLNATNDLDLIASFINEIKKIYTPKTDIIPEFSDINAAKKLLYKHLFDNNIFKLSIPFLFESLDANDETCIKCFLKLLSFFKKDFTENNHSEIYLYFLIQIKDSDVKSSKLYQALRKSHSINMFSVLQEIEKRDIEKWSELITDDIDCQEQITEDVVKYLNENGKVLPTRMEYLRKPLDTVLNEFHK